MGKKGTKRKTKWRALPLGEEAGGSGNEEELLDEDQSTTSSVVGNQPSGISYRRQSFYYRMPDKSFRQTRKFGHDKFRSKEPLVKLESKTFDEEEYTKITTPRQDVLFKKGYFGRKKESSLEENSLPGGEMEGEEALMDQIIITNGFVDERGHYLVNGNSYEIYDPYSNTVTVVVGPPPYANGVTQPVLAAVSCQPVPLQPVDWYPPGADWPAQGSAWTPSYSRTSHPDSAAASDCAPNFPSPDAQIPNLYNQLAYVVPGYSYGESPHFNGMPVQTSPSIELKNSEEYRQKKTRKMSTETAGKEEEEEEKEGEREGGGGGGEGKGKGEGEAEADEEKKKGNEKEKKEKEEKKVEVNEKIKSGEEMNSDETKESSTFVQETLEIANVVSTPPSSYYEQNNTFVFRQTVPTQIKSLAAAARQVEKQNHSTQTNLLGATVHPKENALGKESHSTQTPPEEVLESSHVEILRAHEKNSKRLSDDVFSCLPKTEEERKPIWKHQGNKFSNSLKKFHEESPKRSCQPRVNPNDERKFNVEKANSSPLRVSYAKKAMSGLGNANSRVINGSSDKVVNGAVIDQNPVANGPLKSQGPFINRIPMDRVNNEKRKTAFENKRNGFLKTRYNNEKTTSDQTSSKYKDKKFEQIIFDESEKKFENSGTNELRSSSDKSSTVSELSSPTCLSSGQNTPPEKLIVQTMEEKINMTFEQKLKQNLVKDENEDENKKEEKYGEKPKGKKKKNKGKPEDKQKDQRREKKKKKKRILEEPKGKSESENSSEDIAFLSNIQEKDSLFEGWDGLNKEDDNFISEMNSLLNGDKEILKFLGLNGDKSSYSKLPLHSDLLMMLPTFGWTRPKLKIENFFAPSSCGSDLFTKRNITSMKSTKPEEFFASVIESPVAGKAEKKKERQKKLSKQEETSIPMKKTSKAGCKGSKNDSTKKDQLGETKCTETEVKEGRLGIVEAVNTWLEEQGGSEKFISVESFKSVMTNEESFAEETGQKNGAGNPIHAPSRDENGASVGDFQEEGECIRVANVINDGFVHVSHEFPAEKKSSRMYRSSSWDAKLSQGNIKKHFKFLTDSAYFCQDLISDVRNGLPTGNEYATEELCDPRQTVAKYYTLAPSGRLRNESDSENEVFDALEYKFLTKEHQDPDGKTFDVNGNASITDSGVHSDMESSEDNVPELQKEATCKLQ